MQPWCIWAVNVSRISSCTAGSLSCCECTVRFQLLDLQTHRNPRRGSWKNCPDKILVWKKALPGKPGFQHFLFKKTKTKEKIIRPPSASDRLLSWGVAEGSPTCYQLPPISCFGLPFWDPTRMWIMQILAWDWGKGGAGHSRYIFFAHLQLTTV